MKKKFKLIVIALVLFSMTGCVTVYKNSTVMQYKGSAELQTDSVKIELNNKSLNVKDLSK